MGGSVSVHSPAHAHAALGHWGARPVDAGPHAPCHVCVLGRRPPPQHVHPQTRLHDTCACPSRGTGTREREEDTRTGLPELLVVPGAHAVTCPV